MAEGWNRCKEQHRLSSGFRERRRQSGYRSELCGQANPLFHLECVPYRSAVNSSYCSTFPYGMNALISFSSRLYSHAVQETFIEDTATYTVRAENEGGVAESSAKLTVKCGFLQ